MCRCLWYCCNHLLVLGYCCLCMVIYSWIFSGYNRIPMGIIGYVSVFSSAVISLRCYSLCKTMYRPAKEVDWCQCCQRGVALADAEGAADLFGDHDAAEVVDTANNASCFHISFSFSRRGHSRMSRGRFMNRPYNNFTNYDAIICK